MNTDIRRHGDVLLITQKGFKIPKEIKMKTGKLIHKGNNNSHVISKGSVSFGELDGKRFMRVLKPSIVSHVGGSATHASKPIPKGDYWIEIQTYFDHCSEEAKQVVD